MAVLQDVTSCSYVGRYQQSREPCYLHRQDRNILPWKWRQQVPLKQWQLPTWHQLAQNNIHHEHHCANLTLYYTMYTILTTFNRQFKKHNKWLHKYVSMRDSYRYVCKCMNFKQNEWCLLQHSGYLSNDRFQFKSENAVRSIANYI